jgi:uncharacterized membrane protein
MKRLFLFFAALMVISIGAAFAQDPVPPGTTLEWLGRFAEWIGSFPGVVVSVFFLAPVVIGATGQVEAKKIVKYIITGVLVVAHIVAASLLEMGYLHNAKLWYIILNALFVGGAQVFGYALFHDALDRVAEKFNPWKPSG